MSLPANGTEQTQASGGKEHARRTTRGRATLTPTDARPARLVLDRLATPVGWVLLVTDERGVLCSCSVGDGEAGMRSVSYIVPAAAPMVWAEGWTPGA